VWSSRGEEEARDEQDDVVMLEVRGGGKVGRRDEGGIDEAVQKGRKLTREERREKRGEGKSEKSVPSCASIPTGLPYAAYYSNLRTFSPASPSTH
jgi:hypothetical protein